MKNAFRKNVLVLISIAIVGMVIYAVFWMQSVQSAQTYYDDYIEASREPLSVETLILRNRSLQSLPAGIGAFKNLKVLNVGNNQLTDLPTEIAQLRQLEELILEHNQLNQLPLELFSLPKLKILNLNHN